MLSNAGLFEILLSAITSYLQKWRDYAQNGLTSFLYALDMSSHGEWALVHGIDILSTAQLGDAMLLAYRHEL